jgi:hypothetical protein
METRGWLLAASLTAAALAIACGAESTDTDTDKPQTTESSPATAAPGAELTVTPDTQTMPAADGSPSPTAGALPFTFELVEQHPSADLPALHSYLAAPARDGRILIVGGRTQGLHGMFPPPIDNFPKERQNPFMYVIDPNTAQTWEFDVRDLPDELHEALRVSNPQGFYDHATDRFTMAGGYGWNIEGTNMLTLDTLIHFDVSDMIDAIAVSNPNAQKIAGLMTMIRDDFFAVTGGALKKIGNAFFLVMGQKFEGQVRAFGVEGFEQKYTEEVRVFTLTPDGKQILTKSALTSSETDRPYHRRDVNVVESVNPLTGNLRIAVLGGVFPPGVLGAYTNPIYIEQDTTVKVDRSVDQLFSQYECAVLPAYDAVEKTVYHTMVGGISSHYFHETVEQDCVRANRTKQGFNDGLPFISDITTILQKVDGSYEQWIHVNPIPPKTDPRPCPNPWPDKPELCANLENQCPRTPCAESGMRACNTLVGASIELIPNIALLPDGKMEPLGVLRLDRLQPGERVLAGYVFGGLESDFPLPLRPGCGTCASNRLLHAYVTRTPEAAYPASMGQKSVQNLSGR